MTSKIAEKATAIKAYIKGRSIYDFTAKEIYKQIYYTRDIRNELLMSIWRL